MPEKMTLAMTQTCPSPPETWPITARAKRKMRPVTPPVFIRLPARMKNGIASSVNPVVEAYMRCGSMVRSAVPSSPTKNATAVSAIATAIGRLIMIRTSSTAKMSRVSMGAPPGGRQNESRAGAGLNAPGTRPGDHLTSSTILMKAAMLSSPAIGFIRS